MSESMMIDVIKGTILDMGNMGNSQDLNRFRHSFKTWLESTEVIGKSS